MTEKHKRAIESLDDNDKGIYDNQIAKIDIQQMRRQELEKRAAEQYEATFNKFMHAPTEAAIKESRKRAAEKTDWRGAADELKWMRIICLILQNQAEEYHKQEINGHRFAYEDHIKFDSIIL
jgi:hypothetical protein